MIQEAEGTTQVVPFDKIPKQQQQAKEEEEAEGQFTSLNQSRNRMTELQTATTNKR